MIYITGSVERSFIFPANRQTAFDFYADMSRVLEMIPHISLMEMYADDKFRMLYSTTELGLYRVRMVCNLQTDLDYENWVLRILPLEGAPTIKNKISMYALSAQGQYSSESIFKPQGDQTEIEYRLRLQAELPVPFGIRFMPNRLLNDIAQGITQWRITEIAEGFIKRSLEVFANGE